MTETLGRVNPHTQKKIKPPVEKIVRKIGNKRTYSGLNNMLWGVNPKGLRMRFKKYVHILNSGPKYHKQHTKEI